jgi:hypothetical protein
MTHSSNEHRSRNPSTPERKKLRLTGFSSHADGSPAPFTSLGVFKSLEIADPKILTEPVHAPETHMSTEAPASTNNTSAERIWKLLWCKGPDLDTRILWIVSYRHKGKDFIFALRTKKFSQPDGERLWVQMFGNAEYNVVMPIDVAREFVDPETHTVNTQLIAERLLAAIRGDSDSARQLADHAARKLLKTSKKTPEQLIEDSTHVS